MKIQQPANTGGGPFIVSWSGGGIGIDPVFRCGGKILVVGLEGLPEGSLYTRGGHSDPDKKEFRLSRGEVGRFI